MKWKRVLIVSFVTAALALSLYAVSLAHAGIRTMQTSETDRAERREVLRLRADDFITTLGFTYAGPIKQSAMLELHALGKWNGTRPHFVRPYVTTKSLELNPLSSPHFS